MGLDDYLRDTAGRVTLVAGQNLVQDAEMAIALLVEAFNNYAPVLICGNGGSAADAQHIAAELVGRFRRDRRGLNAIALSTNSSVVTAWSNDVDFSSVFERQVEAHGASGGVLWAISTSGNSENVVRAAIQAHKMDMRTIALTGRGPNRLTQNSQVAIAVELTDTAHIQELHLPIYHYICERVEAAIGLASRGEA